MKKFILTNIIISFFLFNTLNADSNTAFIDMEKVLTNSIPGSSILKQLNELNDKNLENLKKQEKKLLEKENILISQKNIISEIEYKAKVNDLKNEINDYKKNRQKKIDSFNKLKVTNTNNLLKNINPILVKFSNQKSIAIILQKKNLVIGKIELDITDEIIKIVDKEIKEIKIK
jgi:outer membrane protein